MVSCWARSKGSLFLVGFAGLLMVMVIYFGNVPFLLSLRSVKILSFMISWMPWCRLWHGWLPLLSGFNGGSPWAESPSEGAVNILECALGRHFSGVLSEWQLPVGFDAEGAAGRVVAEPYCLD